MMKKQLSILIFRIFIVAFSVTGMLMLQIKQGVFDFERYVFYTFQSNIIVTIAYSILIIKTIKNISDNRQEEITPHLTYGIHEWVTFTIMVTFIIFAAFLTGYIDMVNPVLRTQTQIGSAFVHYVVPLMVIFDYYVHVRNPNSKFRYAFYNLIYPLTYFGFTIIRAQLGGPLQNTFEPNSQYISRYPYPFIDLDSLEIEEIMLSSIILCCGFVVLGIVIISIDRQLYHRLPRRVVGWFRETHRAHRLKGFDGSSIDDRASSAILPWNYNELVKRFLTDETELLFIGTAGRDTLLSLIRNPEKTTVAESNKYLYRQYRRNLTPLGIRVETTPDHKVYPFPNDSFDLVVNHQNHFDYQEVRRILKPGGIFITQQMGMKEGENLVPILSPGNHPYHKEETLEYQKSLISSEEWEILDGQEAISNIYFYDVGALVYYVTIIKDKFPGFKVKSRIPELEILHKMIETQKYISLITHRYLIILRKNNLFRN